MQRPDEFEVSPDFTYVEFGPYHVSRYDFEDESAPIFLVDKRTDRFAVINFRALHRFSATKWGAPVEPAIEEARKLILRYELDEIDAANEQAREDRWQRQHEAGLRDQRRYI